MHFEKCIKTHIRIEIVTNAESRQRATEQINRIISIIIMVRL